ncbi:MAG: hypothetical protein AB7V08_06135 [Elusimicrobiales bacterium]
MKTQAYMKKLGFIALGLFAGIGLALSPVLLFTLLAFAKGRELLCSFKISLYWLGNFFSAMFLIAGVSAIIYHITVFLDRKTLAWWHKVFVAAGLVFCVLSVCLFFYSQPCSMK